MDFVKRHWVEVIVILVSLVAVIYSLVSQILPKDNLVDEIETTLLETDIQEEESRDLALKELKTMRSLSSTIQNPTEEQQDQYVQASINAVIAIKFAIELNGRNPDNWDILGQIYDELQKTGFEDASGKAEDAYAERDNLKQSQHR